MQKKRGVALFIALVISAIVLTVGIGILTTVFKEIRFSAFGKESAEAFYAADTGLECALYWDFHEAEEDRPFFATSSDSSLPTSAFAWCIDDAVDGPDGEKLADMNWNVVKDSNSATTTFMLRYPPNVANQDAPCIDVTVIKYMDVAVQKTKIESVGRSSCNTNDPRRVERAVRVAY